MKIIYRSIFAFIFFFLFQLLLNGNNYVEIFSQQAYIKNEKPKIVLISENIHRLEIYVGDKNESSHLFLSRGFFVKPNSTSEAILSKRNEIIANANIHNLSTNSLKSNYIRAP